MWHPKDFLKSVDQNIISAANCKINKLKSSNCGGGRCAVDIGEKKKNYICCGPAETASVPGVSI